MKGRPREERLAEVEDSPEPSLLVCFLLYGGAAGLAIWNLLEAGLFLIGNDDFWWGAAAGRFIMENFAIPRSDVFSYTFEGRPWTNLEWLSHVIFYSVYHYLGENWVTYLRIGVIFLIFGITFRMCQMRSGSWLVSLLVVAFGAWVCRPFLDARPQLFTFLNAVLLLYILQLFRQRRRNLLFLIPLILLLWTQQHGGYFFGLLVLIGNLGAESGKRLLHLPVDPLPWNEIRKLAVAVGLAAAALLINPWTVEAYSHPLDVSRQVEGANIFLTATSEWLPPVFLRAGPFSPVEFWPFLMLVALLVLPVAFVRWRAFDLNDVGLAAVLAIFFALRHRRFIPLFVILALPLLSWAIRFWLDRWTELGARRGEASSEAVSGGPGLSRGVVTVAAATWLALLLILPFRLRYLYGRYAVYIHGREAGVTLFRANTHHAYYPESAVRFLREAGVSGPMYNLYNWGGYLQYFLPELKTFIDGRGWTVFDQAFYRQYLSVRWGHPVWREVFERHGVQLALIHQETNEILFESLDQDPRWTWVFGHGASAVFVKEGAANEEVLARFRARRLPPPETGMSHFLYGRQAEMAGSFARAVEDFSRACELAPRDGDFRARYVRALSLAGRSEEALAEGRRAVKAFPASIDVALAQAGILAEVGRRGEALGIYEQILRRSPERSAAVDGLLGLDFEYGRRLIAELHQAQPGRPWLSFSMGRLAELSMDLEGARRHYTAEGLAAEQAGDQGRLLRARRALERAEARWRQTEAD